MKNFFWIGVSFLMLLTLSCSYALAESERDVSIATIPNEVVSFVKESRWDGWEIASWVNPSQIQNSNACGFAVVKNGTQNVLLAFGWQDNRWTYQWFNASALPQVQDTVQLCDDELVNDGLHGARFSSFYLINNETMECRCFWLQKDNGSWYLVAMNQYKPLMFYDTSKENALRLYNTGWVAPPETDVWVYGSYQTNMRYFDLSDFPKTVEEARMKLSSPPLIPEGTLSAQDIQFSSGQKFKVYQGPGIEYGQAGQGKAVVSTNDWIQVFGVENEWLMIQYDITSEHMRIGWILEEALPKSASIDELTFSPCVVSILENVSITDDPLYSEVSIATLDKNTQVNWFATMGEWAYIETIDANPIRGFVRIHTLVKE